MNKRTIVIAVVAVAVVVAAVVVITSLTGDSKYGTEFPVSGESTSDSTHEVRVSSGDTFSLVVRDSPSIGDSWALQEKPDGAVAFKGEERVSESGGDGGSAKRYYTFEATSAGNARVVLENKFRGGRAGYTVTVTITVS